MCQIINGNQLKSVYNMTLYDIFSKTVNEHFKPLVDFIFRVSINTNKRKKIHIGTLFQ